MKNNELVIYGNDFNSMPLPKLTEIEMILFMTIISKLKENRKLEFNFLDFISELHLNTHLSIINLRNIFLNLIQKIFTFEVKYKTKNNTYNFICFEKTNLDFDTNKVEIKAHKDFFKLINRLELGFTHFKLAEFSNIRGRYAKNLYRIFKQFKHTGKVLIYKNDWQSFCDFMQIPASYKMANIDQRVINPAIKELSKYFKNLRYQKIKDTKSKGRGGKVVGIEFYFKAERIYNETNKELTVETTLIEPNYFNTDFDTDKQKIEYLEQKVDFLQLLLSTTSYKLKIFMYILNNLEYENKLCQTKHQIAKEVYHKIESSNISNAVKLVHKTLKELEQKEIIKKVGADYIITSDFINNFKEEAKFILTNALINRTPSLYKRRQKYDNKIK